jgi:hypothetical protein|tara:strand:+ start:950 stop:2407 length:1458 start_codon:yes stop_codon:yes gene_type:complete
MALAPQFGSIKPSQKQQALDSNYLNFTDGTTTAFAEQYLPEVYEQEIERYGNRTLSGFLRMVGAEMPMTSDQVIWSEQNRLHVSYTGVVNAVVGNVSTLTIPLNLTPADPKDYVANVISKNQTIVIIDPATNAELKALVLSSNVTTGDLEVAPYTAADTSGLGATGLKIFVYGSEYAKGSTLAADDYQSITPSFTQFSNSPIIIRNKYVVSGSDTAQIGWVEVATEDGTSGYLWYLKAESETRLRFEDYLEMSMVEGELAAAGSKALASGKKGTQGFFAAINDRGNVNSGFDATTGLGQFDEILQNLDTQGAIEENMLFLNRISNLAFDDMLSGVGSPTGAGAVYGGGSSFGVFENSEEMALNLGFSGFRRGSYDFYKTDWKYLNDASTRGAADPLTSSQVGDIQGVLVPAGTSTVYDQVLGTNIRRPFLHVRYRASQADDRRMKNWVTGSVGAATSDLDAMEVHFLSERCLCVQGANNFVLFTV